MKDKRQTLKDLPLSIPEVYFDYLKRLNPKAPGAPNRMDDYTMLQVGELLGDLSVARTNFRVQEFKKTEALKALNQFGPKALGEIDPLRRLVDNGVLKTKERATDIFYWFALEPIAQYLAAMKMGRDCSNCPEKWRDLEERITRAEANDFLEKLRVVQTVYGESYGWFTGTC